MIAGRAPRSPGRLLAWAALAVALVASVVANVAYARPAVGPRLSSGVAPVLVILAAGLLERVPLAGVQVWRRLLAYVGLGAVIGAAFVTSFEHQFALLLRYGNTRLSSALLPIAVDGLIVLASVCLTVIAERQRAAQDVKPTSSLVHVSLPESAHPVPAPEPDVEQPRNANPGPSRVSQPSRKAVAFRTAPDRAAQRVEALKACAAGDGIAEILCRWNGDAPTRRTVELWTRDLRALPIEARAAKLTELLDMIGAPQ